MVDLIRAIKEGIKLSSFFHSKFYGAIQFRPISNSEVDHVLEMVFANRSIESIALFKKIKFKDTEVKVELSLELLEEIDTMWEEMDYWICFHALKDFQPEEWKTPDENSIPLGIRIMKDPNSYLEFHDLADKIMTYSWRPRNVVRSVIKTKAGKQIATAYWNLDWKLAETLRDLTDLQIKFVLESYGISKDPEKEEKSYDTMEDLMKDLNFKPFSMTKSQKKVFEDLEMRKVEFGKHLPSHRTKSVKPNGSKGSKSEPEGDTED